MRTIKDNELRWNDYVFALDDSQDSPEALWHAASEIGHQGRSMYLLGVGFDPRALVGLERYLAMNHRRSPVVGLIELSPPSPLSDATVTQLAERNRANFRTLVKGVELRSVSYMAGRTPSNTGLRVSREATGTQFMDDIEHLIVDISSLPSMLYFPILAAALKSVDTRVQEFPRQLQVVACENPHIDGAVRELEVSKGAFVGGFRGDLMYDTDPNRIVVWAPIIGENSSPALLAIHDYLSPSDVFPVLPFPSKDPRRGDNLLLEYQIELLDSFRVTPGNIIYADERNPFDVYRELSRLQRSVRTTLRELGRTTLAVSAHSSKVLSLGVLLAAYEHQLPIVTAPPRDYSFMPGRGTGRGRGQASYGQSQANLSFDGDHRLLAVWLTGIEE